MSMNVDIKRIMFELCLNLCLFIQIHKFRKFRFTVLVVIAFTIRSKKQKANIQPSTIYCCVRMQIILLCCVNMLSYGESKSTISQVLLSISRMSTSYFERE